MRYLVRRFALRAWTVTALLAVALVLGQGLGPPGNPGRLGLRADPQGIKYTGAGRCAAATCHGGVKEQLEGSTRHNENIIWSSKDAHAKGYQSLLKEESLKMGKTLKLEVAKSERCLSCHALSGISLGTTVNRISLKPEQIDKDKYSVEDGVSCDACHGPGAKYLEPHAKLGWTQNQRKALGGVKLFDEWGLYDTKDAKLRANVCISCHLKIDHELIEAGHPELPFELNVYGQGEWIHWRDKEKWFGGKVWTLGQVVSLREAAGQLAERVEKKVQAGLVLDSYKQTVAHLLLARQACASLGLAELAALDKQVEAVHREWKDPAKVVLALRELAKVAEAAADAINAKTFDQGLVEKLVKGVAAEGKTAGAFGFRASEQYCTALTSLWGTLTRDGPPPDAEKVQGVIDALYDPLGKPAEFKKEGFLAAVDKLLAAIPGGNALALPPGSPTEVGSGGAAVQVAQAGTPAAQPVAPVKEPAPVVADKPVAAVKEPAAAVPDKPVAPVKEPAPVVDDKPVAPVKEPAPVADKPVAPVKEPPPATQRPEGGAAVERPAENPDGTLKREPLPRSEWGKFIFCINCGRKWERGAKAKYCGRCGEKLPELE